MSTLRVISGTARGMRLKSVPGKITRPITDRVKESLFNIIGADIWNAALLDLFAGTGSVGIEALSRGASYVHFNDRHHAAIKTIRENLLKTKLGDHAKISQMDAFELLKTQPERTFDYIFIAPPQYKGLWSQTLRLLDQNDSWLSKDAWVIIQIDPTEYESLHVEKIKLFDKRKYGSTLLLFLSP